jgi:hypothetical protein
MDSRRRRSADVPNRAPVAAVAAAICALLAVVLAGCTGGDTPPLAVSSASNSDSAAIAQGAPGPPAAGAPSTLTGTVSGHPTTGSSGRTGAADTKAVSVPSGMHGKKTAVLAAPYKVNPSGVICSYVPQSAVSAILPGTGGGQENDIDLSAVSYCAFANSDGGSVTVGVKRLGSVADATGRVHSGYSRMADEPDQSVRTFSADSGFAFEIGSSTPLQNGSTIYAMNAQGSRGAWYVAIQYYARKSVSTASMEVLLTSVLAKIPNS